MKKLLSLVAALLFATSLAFGQTSTTGTTTLSLTVAAEAAIRVDTSTTTLSSGSIFANYTGTTNLTYWIRTSSGGTGSIVHEVTSDFSPASGPSVGTPPTAGDTLTYTCTAAAPGTACVGSQTASTASTTSVATFGNNAKSAKTGNSAATSWTLTNDPQYAIGTYTATVTYTISAT